MVSHPVQKNRSSEHMITCTYDVLTAYKDGKKIVSGSHSLRDVTFVSVNNSSCFLHCTNMQQSVSALSGSNENIAGSEEACAASI